jgi:hypothetical protein
MELHGLRPNFHIHVSVSDLYIPGIDVPFLLKENIWTNSESIQGADDKLGQTLRTPLKQ